jgi:multiple sugar transport system substrate-binding protein
VREKTFRVAVRQFGPFESAIQKQWQQFQIRHGTGLQLEAIPFDLESLSEEIFGARDWDVLFLNTDWIAAALERELLVDLAPFISENPPDGYPEGWSESLMRMQCIEGQIFGLPYHDGPECLIYRTELIQQPPQTWDEFHTLARSLTRAEDNLYGTAFAAFPDGHNTVYDFLLQLWTRGGEGTQLDSAPAREGLEFYHSILADRRAVHPRSREMDSIASGLAFARGEIAMMVNWFGFAVYAETNPDSRVKGRIEIAEVPRGANGRTVSLNVYWLLGIPKTSIHPDLAYEFLRHCGSQEMDRLLTLEGGVGCRRSTWSDGEVNRRVRFFHKLERLHENAWELPQRSDWPAIAKQIDQLMTSK